MRAIVGVRFEIFSTPYPYSLDFHMVWVAQKFTHFRSKN